MKLNNLKRNETGGLSIIYAVVVMILLFILASALMSSFGSVLKGSTNRLTKSKTFYAAEAGLELAVWDLMNEGSGELSNVDVSGVSVNTTVVGDSVVTIEADKNGISTGIQVYFDLDSTILDDMAIYCTDTVDNVAALDSLGNPDPDLIEQFADSLPTIAYTDLINLANAQGLVQTAAEFKPSNGYPNGSFYYSPGVPNVTQVQGNLNVIGSRTIHGIFIVEGDAVVMSGSSRLDGILYLPNANSVFNGGGDADESVVTGGIVVNGTVEGNGDHIKIHHVPEYMKIFSFYERSRKRFKMFQWIEL
jgi:hypothetical protein